jgi:hypothetical protein
MTSLTQILKRYKFFWEKHLTQWRDSDLNQAEYCRNHNLKEHSFSYQKCKRLNKTSTEANVSSGFIQVQLSRNQVEPAPLTLHLNNDTYLSGITESNLALVKQLAQVLA